MKGQFLIIASVLGGLILISTATMISEIEEKTHEPDFTPKKLDIIHEEFEDADLDNAQNREALERMVSDIDGFSTQIEYYEESGNWCANVTLSNPDKYLEMNCLS